MKTFSPILALGLLLVTLCFSGCATQKPYDYANFRAHYPRSILVLPPLNESTAVEGTYSYLSTVTRPLTEMGYYVFPVAVVDQFMKENGMPGPGEMHQVPMAKVWEITGADSVMFITLKQYGSKYQIINSATTVTAQARLVDTRTETLLWEGVATAQQNSGGTGNILGDLISAAITQAVNASTDAAHNVSKNANQLLFTTKNHGLLLGHYHPQFGAQKEALP